MFVNFELKNEITYEIQITQFKAAKYKGLAVFNMYWKTSLHMKIVRVLTEYCTSWWQSSLGR